MNSSMPSLGGQQSFYRPTSDVPCSIPTPRMSSARPIAHVLVITKNTNSSDCYNAVTALTNRFCQNAVGPARPPGPSPTRQLPASGARTAAVSQVRWSCRRSTFAPHCGLRTASVMRNEHSDKYTPRPPLCPSCGKIMRLARTTWRFENLPDRYTFECRACGLSYIEAAWIEAA
jgi:hypothetical protein